MLSWSRSILLTMPPNKSIALENIPAGCLLDDTLECFDINTAMQNAWPRHCSHYHVKCRLHFTCIYVPCNEHSDAPANIEIQAQNAPPVANYIVQALNDAGALVLTASRAANQTLNAIWINVSCSSSSVASFKHMHIVLTQHGYSLPFLSPLPSSSSLLLPTFQQQYIHAFPIALPSPPLPDGSQDKPMRMHTSFKESSRRQWLPPRCLTSVEIKCAPSVGVTVGLIPKPEPKPESDPEADSTVKHEGTTASPCTPLFDPNSSNEDKHRGHSQPRVWSITNRSRARMPLSSTQTARRILPTSTCSASHCHVLPPSPSPSSISPFM
ncbi:hypothetical protein B0H16DRAFT_1767106 [Mycena metata]|uniref:Uncharacterized protein n=1 Tax=Mycena metata TaxID=1033252 RepID=A0AAD7MW38_9AGAR|nr:hypothetical protein B0H16DRAFT_1767106 [Mycena metata]